ncbi:NADH pyrophosphatase [Aspergillus heteromorphus CBS 117.55]|uniref:NAD(+) diphosphatase n=1 Tax=Aspergillus heteromorphus CBS 117.55 TaxID=1448321 RepID=A0A317W177_9EURO|nr:NADH pyrophosphatase [Aspergillus heteromorphus CBS 117.55]PWY79639.1 NADH pyrophosphatase [Aspergillus heteromorphus CBS 117.55]
MSGDSQIPNPAHIQADSMLARHFGRETVNYFSSSPLNRLSFLRSDHTFLSAALKHPSTRFVLMKDLAPLTRNPTEPYFAKYEEVRTLVPDTIYDKSEEDFLKEYDSRKTIAAPIFLGLDESHKQDGLAWKIYTGIPYFALDVTPSGSDEQQTHAKALISEVEAKGLIFLQGRTILSFPANEAAIYAQARALIDWNTRNRFCGTCGHPTISVNSGTKRACPPSDAALLAAGKPAERPACNTRTTISNLSFPRTDPTIIVAVVSTDAKRILLGRSKRFPPSFYSTLAGFIEPAESVEDAVRREVWEEAGVTLSRVVIHSSQPWPYPANLMIGAIAQVSDPAHETINLEHDPELEDAKWFDIAEVEDALRIGVAPLGEKPGPEYKEGGLRLPPPTAIANQLIRAAISLDFLDAEKAAKM